MSSCSCVLLSLCACTNSTALFSLLVFSMEHSPMQDPSQSINDFGIHTFQILLDLIIGCTFAYFIHMGYRSLKSPTISQSPNSSTNISRCSSAEPRSGTPNQVSVISGTVPLNDIEHFVEVLTSPGFPTPCANMEKFGMCNNALKGYCPNFHGRSSAQKLRSYISKAQLSVDIAAQSITSHQIAALLRELHFRGVRIRMVRDYDNLVCLRGTEEITKLQEIGIPIKVNGYKLHKADRDLRVLGILHHKFVIIDGLMVISGSANFTLKAALNNYEVSVVTDIPAIVQQYVEAFNGRWEEFSCTK